MDKVWEVMNELEMITSKICSARDILDSATDAIQQHRYDKAESMITAAHEFLGYYLDEFDKKFKDAWQETVVSGKKGEIDVCDKDDLSEHCKQSWRDFWGEEIEMNKAKKWVLPIQSCDENLFINLPNDLLDKVGWKEGDELTWTNNRDGSFTLNKCQKTYYEMIEDGWTMTDDGFWIKE